MTVRPMTIEDYDAARALWNACLASPRDVDDTPEAVERFLRRNPGLSVVALTDSREAPAPPQVVGSILCGHDGRRGYLYHVAVDAAHRRGGVGHAMVAFCLAALRVEGIHKCALIAFTSNGAGNAFWNAMGFDRRGEIHFREKML